MRGPRDSKDRFELTRRLTPLLILFGLFLVTVGGRVLYLQLALGQELRKQSQVNRIKHDILPARRGTIVDRNGVVLAADEPVFDLVRTGPLREARRAPLRELVGGMDLRLSRLRNRLFEQKKRILVRGLSDSSRIWFAENSHRYPSLEIQIRPRRVYRYGSVTAPVLGYTGEINPAELNRRRREGLSQGEIVGKTGVEKVYDPRLQGQDGIRWVETTARGDLIRVLESPPPSEPEPGDSVALNLDVRLQKAVAKSFPSDSAGAAVVMEIPSGKIRALYSHPSYDPNRIVSGQSRRVRKLLHDPEDPLHNRVIQSRFPPGSTFKILPFLAALLDGSYAADQSFSCSGEYRLGDHTFGCWKEEGHGRLTLPQGLVHSCNVYFYNLALDLGYPPIVRLARRLQFGRPTGVDLPGEKPSQLSTPSLKRNRYSAPWVKGDVLNAVIGQGYTLVSPIKQAQMLGSLLTGRRIRPRVAQSRRPPRPPESLDLPEGPLKRLRSTLDAVADRGTGYWAQHTPRYRRLDVDLLGKTGTVQKVKREDEADTPPADAWFISAAPTDNPRYVLVLFRIEAGSGGSAAAPHARRIYRHMIRLGYFEDPPGDAS